MFLNILNEINNLDKNRSYVFSFPNLNNDFIKMYNNKKLNFSQLVLYKAFSQKNIFYKDFDIKYAFKKLFYILSTEIFIVNYEYILIYILELADTYQVHNLLIRDKNFHNILKNKISKILNIINKNIFYKYYTTNDIYFSKDRSENYRKNLALNFTDNIKQELFEIALNPLRLEYFLTNDEKIKYGFKII